MALQRRLTERLAAWAVAQELIEPLPVPTPDALRADAATAAAAYWVAGGCLAGYAPTLTSLARFLDVSAATVHLWTRANQARHAEMKRARDVGGGVLAEQGLELVDQASAGDLPRALAQSRYRQWLAEKWSPETYGAKAQAPVSVSVSVLHVQAHQALSGSRIGYTEVLPGEPTAGMLPSGTATEGADEDGADGEGVIPPSLPSPDA